MFLLSSLQHEWGTFSDQWLRVETELLIRNALEELMPKRGSVIIIISWTLCAWHGICAMRTEHLLPRETSCAELMWKGEAGAFVWLTDAILSPKCRELTSGPMQTDRWRIIAMFKPLPLNHVAHQRGSAYFLSCLLLHLSIHTKALRFELY